MDTDIIIPIYNAFDFTKKCIETVIEHTDLTKHTLLLINDKSTDQRILPLLNLFTAEYPSLNIAIINNESNQGFVRTVNIGMQHSLRCLLYTSKVSQKILSMLIYTCIVMPMTYKSALIPTN